MLNLSCVPYLKMINWDLGFPPFYCLNPCKSWMHVRMLIFLVVFSPKMMEIMCVSLSLHSMHWVLEWKESGKCAMKMYQVAILSTEDELRSTELVRQENMKKMSSWTLRSRNLRLSRDQLKALNWKVKKDEFTGFATKELRSTEGMTDDHFGWLSRPFGQLEPQGNKR